MFVSLLYDRWPIISDIDTYIKFLLTIPVLMYILVQHEVGNIVSLMPLKNNH